MGLVFNQRFAGKVAVVTGSSVSPGIGRSCADRLAREGASVVINGRRQSELDAAARELSHLGITSNVINPGATDTGWMTPQPNAPCAASSDSASVCAPCARTACVSSARMPCGTPSANAGSWSMHARHWATPSKSFQVWRRRA